MRGINKVILIGTVGRDPEVRSIATCHRRCKNNPLMPI